MRGTAAFAALYLATYVLTLGIVLAAAEEPPSARSHPASPPASVSPTPTPDLAARVFVPAALPPQAPTVDRSPLATIAPTAEALERGAVLFVWRGCVLCHGTRAEGLVGPRIAATSLSVDAVRRQVRTPRNAYMPPFSPQQLSEDELTHIYAFLRSLGGD